MAEEKTAEEGDEYVTLRMHVWREKTVREFGGVDVIVSRDMVPLLNAASEGYEYGTSKQKLVEALGRRIEWRPTCYPVVTVVATRFSTEGENDQVYHCRYDETNGKWYFRAAKKGKPNK
jgi:hypothetical protein